MSKRPIHPRPSPKPSPEPAPRRARSGAPSALQQQVVSKMKAYPGTTTYLDLIRKNKRDSFLLMVGMVLLGMTIGAVIGGVIGYDSGVYRDPVRMNDQAFVDMFDEPVTSSDINDQFENSQRFRDEYQERNVVLGIDKYVIRSFLPSLLLGAGVALVVGVGGALWSYFQGANAILHMIHAKQITPQLDPELFNVVDEMRLAAGLPMPKVYLIPESALNAFATGRDPEHGVVAITTGLRAKLNRDELQGVIAHEMAHIRHFDIRFSLLMATMVGLIVMTCDMFLRISLHSGRSSGRSSNSKGGGAGVLILIVVAVLLSIIAPILAKFIQMAYSRQREYLADAGAVELTRNPEGLASALSKLAGDEEPLVDLANRGTAHMYIVNPLRKMRKSHQSLRSMFSSHPPVADRIARLMALAR